jgi:hypothetical protein
MIAWYIENLLGSGLKQWFSTGLALARTQIYKKYYCNNMIILLQQATKSFMYC